MLFEVIVHVVSGRQKTVSVCNPSFYSKRFVDFVGNVVFKPIGIEKVREFTHQRHTAEV